MAVEWKISNIELRYRASRHRTPNVEVFRAMEELFDVGRWLFDVLLPASMPGSPIQTFRQPSTRDQPEIPARSGAGRLRAAIQKSAARARHNQPQCRFCPPTKSPPAFALKLRPGKLLRRFFRRPRLSRFSATAAWVQLSKT